MYINGLNLNIASQNEFWYDCFKYNIYNKWGHEKMLVGKQKLPEKCFGKENLLVRKKSFGWRKKIGKICF